MAIGCKYLTAQFEPMIAEGMAVIFSLQVAANIGFRSLQVETNWSVLNRAISSNSCHYKIRNAG